MPYRFVPIGPNVSLQEALAVLNANFAQLDSEVVTKVFNAAGGNPGFLQGKLPNGLGYGFLMYTPDGKVAIACYINASGTPILKIAKDGYDALTATNDQLIFNSAQNVFKIANTGTIDFPSLPGASAHSFQQDTVTADTGVASSTPLLVRATWNDGTRAYPLPKISTASDAAITQGGIVRFRYEASSFLSGGTVWVRIDGINYASTSQAAFTVRYYLEQETAL